jgi:hypothetical protein
MFACHLLIGFAAVLLLPNECAAQARKSSTKWDYVVVSTPDFLGPFRGDDPTFQQPLPRVMARPQVDGSREGLIGVLEVIVGTDGKTSVEKMLKTLGPTSRNKISDVVTRWQFKPARLDGRPIRVRLRVTVHNPPTEYIEGRAPRLKPCEMRRSDSDWR